MTIKEFTEKYYELCNTENVTKQDIIDLAKSVIVKTYAPVMDKKLVLDRQLQRSILEKDGIEYIDQFLSKINMVFAITSLYTDLTITDKADGGYIMDDYDMLMSTGMIKVIVEQIGQDIEELMTLKACSDNSFIGQQTTKAFIGSQVTRFGNLIGKFTGSALTQLNALLQDNERMDAIGKKVMNTVEAVKGMANGEDEDINTADNTDNEE